MPGGVSPELAANLLDTALSSGDETVILGALGSLTSVPVAARNWDQVHHHFFLLQFENARYRTFE